MFCSRSAGSRNPVTSVCTSSRNTKLGDVSATSTRSAVASATPTAATLAVKKSAWRASAASDAVPRNARDTKRFASVCRHVGELPLDAQLMTLAGLARTLATMSSTQFV